MRYFVVQTTQVLADECDAEVCECSKEEQACPLQAEVALVPCEDSREVHAAIAPLRQQEGADWRLFEMVGKRAVSRAVVFKVDGRVSYDVEIS